MNFLNDITSNTLIICDNSFKKSIYQYLDTINKLINIKVMSLNEFYDNYFFSYNEKTIYYLKENYQLTREIATIYLNNLKYIVDSNSNHKKILYLKKIYQDLNDNKLLERNNLFKDYLNKTNIIVLNKNLLDEFTLNIFNNYHVSYLDIKTNKRESNLVYHFKTIDEEVEFVFNEISKLLKNDIDIKNIKIINPTSEYDLVLKRFSYLYRININGLNQYSIMSSIKANKIINMIKDNVSKQEIYEYLINNQDEMNQKILNIINKYYFVEDLNKVRDFIENDFLNTNINEYYQDAIELVELDSNISDEDYVFFMGFNMENIPKTYKDIEYFNDTLKTELGLLTSFKKNEIARSEAIKNINNIKNIYISYKETDPYNSFYPSNLIEDLKLEIKETKLLNETSNLYNKIKLTKNLDILLKYGIISDNLDILYNTYSDIKYLEYNNKFSYIKDFHLDKINLSYSSLNTYYQCSFRYYIDNILKLNIYEEKFKQFVGNLFHFVLSKIYDKDFSFEDTWNSYLNGREFNSQELFYLKDLKEDLKSIIQVLKYHYELTGLTNIKNEIEIKIKLSDKYFFKGIIDKVMFKEKDGFTYLAIIDYKTGVPKINMTNLKYGIDMQLPIYVYLTLNSNLFNNPKIIGFYLEQILHEKVGFNKKDIKEVMQDKLKLQGYSIDDPYLISIFDSSYENSDMIKGMKITSKGFSHYTKVLSDSAILNLKNIVEDKIKEAFTCIDNGKFVINPKIIGGENLGCNFCKYRDLCFKTGKDLVYLKDEENLDYLENLDN